MQFLKKIIATTFALLFTLCISAQILVIPDVHGRRFWKEAVDKYLSQPEGQSVRTVGRSVRTVVFLGDYLDPYPSENITPEEALANFKEIIAFKQANMDRVTLLLGNHELHYLDTFYNFSRKDSYPRKNLIRNMPSRWESHARPREGAAERGFA